MKYSRLLSESSETGTGADAAPLFSLFSVSANLLCLGLCPIYSLSNIQFKLNSGSKKRYGVAQALREGGGRLFSLRQKGERKEECVSLAGARPLIGSNSKAKID